VKTSGTITAGAITIPNTDGTANQVLKTDGSGSLSWSTPSTTATAITNATPTSSASGTAGEIRYDTSYIYICVATNTWQRVALSTF
jgi:hypothetical protein